MPNRRAISPAPSLAAGADSHSISRFGFLVFLGGEIMVFGGLLAALVVSRIDAEYWPPIGMPRLPVATTALNSVVLFASCIPMRIAETGLRRGETNRFLVGAAIAMAGGIAFVAVQASEWLALGRAGLVASSGPYGATFFTLIGCHALHVSGAVLWIAIALVGVAAGRFTPAAHLPVELGAIYWYYVSVVWAIIFPLVYLGLR